MSSRHDISPATPAKVVCFVLPSDRGHFNYTIHVARTLSQRGYDIEYFAPASAAAYAPDFASFTALTDPEDDRFDRYTRLCCSLWSHGDTADEANAHFEKHHNSSVAEEFAKEGGLQGLSGLQGIREKLIGMKERVLRPDVALVVYDAAHMYKWMGKHCKLRGVPTLALYPSPYYLHRPDEEGEWDPDNLEGHEPKYPVVRKDTEAVPHPALYTLFPPLVAGCSIPSGRRLVGPVFPPGDVVPPGQEEAMVRSGLRKWMRSAESPIVYVSFGSMIKSGSGTAFDAAQRLIGSLTKGDWRVLIAADPALFEGQSKHLGPDVRIQKWVPQSAVLAEPNVQAFVSHCGATSCAEAMLHGVPVVALPFFHDQRYNGPALVACGGAVTSLLKTSFTQEEVRSAIREAFSASVQERLKEISQDLKTHNGLFEVVLEAERAITLAEDLQRHE